MRKYNRFEKNKTLIWLCLLLVLGLSLGYAILTDQLNLEGSVNYGSIAWDVGFASAVDGGGTITSSPSVSSDKKTVNVSCNVGTSTASEACIVNATIQNNSTFDVELYTEPIISYDNKYIQSVEMLWAGTNKEVYVLDVINSFSTSDILIKITTKELTEDMLPESELNLPVSITMNWAEKGSLISNAILEDKTALFIGDSVQYGQGNSGKGWSYYIGEEYSMSEVKKVAVNGSSFTKNSTGTDRIINQFKNLTGTYDYVILEGGINDLTYGSEWGTLSNSYDIKQNSTIVVEAMEETIHTILTKYPNAKVGYILLYNTQDSGRNGHDTQLDAYHDLLLSVCNKWNIPVLDMYSGSVIHNGERISFDELLDVHNTTYLADGLHLNDAGYQLTYKYIGEWMKTLTTVELPNVGDEDGNDEDEVVEDLPILETVTLKGNSFTATDQIEGLVWTPGYQLASGSSLSYNDTSGKKGRLASVGYVLKVNGGETITINQGDTYNFAIIEVGASGNSTGTIADHWISDSVTLNANTRYVGIYLKRVDEVDWTGQEISGIPNILKIQ